MHSGKKILLPLVLGQIVIFSAYMGIMYFYTCSVIVQGGRYLQMTFTEFLWYFDQISLTSKSTELYDKMVNVKRWISIAANLEFNMAAILERILMAAILEFNMAAKPNAVH